MRETAQKKFYTADKTKSGDAAKNKNKRMQPGAQPSSANAPPVANKSGNSNNVQAEETLDLAELRRYIRENQDRLKSAFSCEEGSKWSISLYETALFDLDRIQESHRALIKRVSVAEKRPDVLCELSQFLCSVQQSCAPGRVGKTGDGKLRASLKSECKRLAGRLSDIDPSQLTEERVHGPKFHDRYEEHIDDLRSMEQEHQRERDTHGETIESLEKIAEKLIEARAPALSLLCQWRCLTDQYRIDFKWATETLKDLHEFCKIRKEYTNYSQVVYGLVGSYLRDPMLYAYSCVHSFPEDSTCHCDCHCEESKLREYSIHQLNRYAVTLEEKSPAWRCGNMAAKWRRG